MQLLGFDMLVATSAAVAPSSHRFAAAAAAFGFCAELRLPLNALVHFGACPQKGGAEF